MQSEVESSCWQLLQTGMGTVEACSQVTGCGLRAKP
jgi:hypothetical protein